MVVHQDDALNFLRIKSPKLEKSNKEYQPFDLVFLDPPFRKNLVEQSAQLLNNYGLVDEALIYVEMEAESTQEIPDNWQLLKEKVTGQVVYQLYQYQA
jgi:16S rRNA (guanine966-N2)-methyltransferase